MPRLTPQAFGFAIAILSGHAALLVFAIRRGLWQQWRSLCMLLGLSSTSCCISLVLFALDAFTGQVSDLIPGCYFYSYWYCELLLAAFQLWMLWEIAGHITGCANRLWLRYLFLALAGVAIASAILISAGAPAPHLGYPVTRLVLAVDRTLWLGWCLLFTALMASADMVGLKWRHQIVVIASGFVIRAIAGTLYSWLLTASNTAALDVMTNCAALLSIGIWALALREAPLLLRAPDLHTAFEATLRQFETNERRDRIRVD